MTGKVIDNSATGILILIIPIAVLMVLLLQAWPVLLALLVLSISIKVWQHYRWKQWSKEVNPYFNQLIKDNQGCLTPLDLSMKANLSGSDARRYLDKKSEEFGAQRQVYEDKGTVYYFLTASALGSIFDESEPLLDLEGEASSPPVPQLIEAPLQTDTPELPSDLSDLPEPSEDAFSTHEIEEALEPLPQVENKELDSQDEEPEDLWTAKDQEAKDSRSLIQAELAKRLDVHSSTVGKRKSDPDFSEWSQSRDPEGIAWEYSLLTREFLPVEKPLSEE
jgi:hypothetical protein